MLATFFLSLSIGIEANPGIVQSLCRIKIGNNLPTDLLLGIVLFASEQFQARQRMIPLSLLAKKSLSMTVTMKYNNTVRQIAIR